MWKSTVVQLNHVYSWQQCEPKFRSASCQAIERFGSFVFYPIFGDGRNKKWSKHISYNVLQILWQFRGQKNKWCSIRNVTVYINLDATTEIEWNVAKERVFFTPFSIEQQKRTATAAIKYQRYEFTFMIARW